MATESSRTILLAEDDSSVAGMLSLALSTRGYAVVHCPDGQAALDRLDGGVAFDLALVDVRMPRVNGVALISRMRAAGHGEPVIAMSAYNDDVQEREVLDAGATRFLRKPFTLAQLDAALAAVLDAPQPGR